MRELKFKAFLANGKMSKPFGLAAHEIDLVNAKIMQYSGIKDVNNNEIYEGDIVKYYYDKQTIISSVTFVNGTFFLGRYWKDDLEVMKDDLEVMKDDLEVMKDDLKVIGNIYENPELIK